MLTLLSFGTHGALTSFIHAKKVKMKMHHLEIYEVIIVLFVVCDILCYAVVGNIISWFLIFFLIRALSSFLIWLLCFSNSSLPAIIISASSFLEILAFFLARLPIVKLCSSQYFRVQQFFFPRLCMSCSLLAIQLQLTSVFIEVFCDNHI